jgi:mannose-6-phosphate isomerase-like protein (cupin superfamily)
MRTSGMAATMTNGDSDFERAPSHIPADAGEPLWFTTNRITIKATARSTGGAFGLWESIVPPGASPALHVHRREDESFWVLEGEVTMVCGDRRITAGPGSLTFLPRGIPHTFVVEGEQPAHLLTLATPGGVERYFAEAGRPAEGPGLPPPGPPDIPLLERVGERFGLEIVGPPLAPRA